MDKKENKNVNKDDNNLLLVGIDLGTSRSIIVTNTGKRFMCPSIVGWPRDMVSAKLFKKTILVGDDAINNQSALDICVPLKNGVISENDEMAFEATFILLKHLVEQVREPHHKKVYGIVGVPARASNRSNTDIIKVSKKVMDSTRVISEPFAVAYKEDKLNGAIIIDIGAGTVDICGTKGRIPSEDDQVTLTTGGNYVDQQLLKSIREKYSDIQIHANITRRIKEKFGFVVTPSKRAVVIFRAKGRPVTYDVTELVGNACASILPEIVGAVESVLITFDPDSQERVLENIIVCGGMSQLSGLRGALEDALKEMGNIRVSLVADPVNAGAEGALKMLLDIPPKYYPELDSIEL